VQVIGGRKGSETPGRTRRHFLLLPIWLPVLRTDEPSVTSVRVVGATHAGPSSRLGLGQQTPAGHQGAPQTRRQAASELTPDGLRDRRSHDLFQHHRFGKHAAEMAVRFR
jgi:hypothetical protein